MSFYVSEFLQFMKLRRFRKKERSGLADDVWFLLFGSSCVECLHRLLRHSSSNQSDLTLRNM